MTDLIARLEAAEAGSLDLSKAVMLSFGFTWRGLNYWNDADEIWRGSGAVTESIDAALVLASRVLPGWEFGTYINRPDVNGRRFTKIEAHRWRDVGPEYAFACASSKASTPALALCAAILRAKGSDQ